MRTTRILAGMLALTAMTAVSGAQMMPGSGGMGSPTPLMAPNGTVLIMRPVFSSQGTSPSGMELVAMTSSGSVAWRQPVGFGMHNLALADGLVVVSEVNGMGPDGSIGSPAAANSQVVAFDLASGATAWATAIDGVAMGITADNDRIYVQVVKPGAAGGSGGGHGGMHGGGGGSGGGMNGGAWMKGSVSLVTLGRDGGILWSERLS